MEAARGSEYGPGRQGAKASAGRTLAQGFCTVTGLVLVAVGVLGFFLGGGDFTTGPGVSGEPLIVFEVNGWHNLVHLASGAFLLLMAAKPATAVTGALAFGLVYVVVTVWGFIDGNDIATIAPVNAPDNFLHLALAVVAILVGVSAGGLIGSARRGAEATSEAPGRA